MIKGTQGQMDLLRAFATHGGFRVKASTSGHYTHCGSLITTL